MPIAPLAPVFTREERNYPTLAESLGAGVQNLLQYKIGELQKQQQRAQGVSFWEKFGATPEQARVIAQSSPDIQKLIATEALKRGGAFGAGMGAQQMPQQAPGDITKLAATGTPTPQPGLGGVFSGERKSPQQLALEQQEKHFAATEERKGKEFEAGQQTDRYKLAEPTIKKINEDFKMAKNQQATDKIVSEINKEGALPQATLFKFAKKLGFEKLFETNDASTMEALLTDEFRNIKANFGGNPSDQEGLRQLSANPANLYLTKAGRETLVDMRNLKYETAKLRSDEKDKLIKENKILPLDFEGQIEQKVQPQIDELFDRFMQKVLSRRDEMAKEGANIGRTFEVTKNVKRDMLSAGVKKYRDTNTGAIYKLNAAGTDYEKVK